CAGHDLQGLNFQLPLVGAAKVMDGDLLHVGRAFADDQREVDHRARLDVFELLGIRNVQAHYHRVHKTGYLLARHGEAMGAFNFEHESGCWISLRGFGQDCGRKQKHAHRTDDPMSERSSRIHHFEPGTGPAGVVFVADVLEGCGAPIRYVLRFSFVYSRENSLIWMYWFMPTCLNSCRVLLVGHQISSLLISEAGPNPTCCSNGAAPQDPLLFTVR